MTWQPIAGLKSQKHVFITRNKYISFRSAVIHSTSSSIHTDINYLRTQKCISEWKRHFSEATVGMELPILRFFFLFAFNCVETQLWNRKRRHADKIIEFWFVCIIYIRNGSNRLHAVHSTWYRVCGWINVLYIRHYRNSSAMRSSNCNHFQMIKFFYFSQMIHWDWLCLLCLLFIFLFIRFAFQINCYDVGVLIFFTGAHNSHTHARSSARTHVMTRPFTWCAIATTTRIIGNVQNKPLVSSYISHARVCYHFITWYSRVVPETVWNGETNIRLCEPSKTLRI